MKSKVSWQTPQIAPEWGRWLIDRLDLLGFDLTFLHDTGISLWRRQALMSDVPRFE